MSHLYVTFLTRETADKLNNQKMKRTLMPAEVAQPTLTSASTLQVLLSQSEDDFYGSLQRIWNNVVKLEDMGIIQQENDKFMYAYRFAEAELQRAYSGQTGVSTTAQIQ